MDASSSIPPTYPFHVAKAYGLSAPAKAPVAASQGVTTASGLTVRPSGDSVQITGGKRAAGVQGLVAARVSKDPSFAAVPTPSQGLPMYRHPADKNAAATGVRVGQSIDLNG